MAKGIPEQFKKIKVYDITQRVHLLNESCFYQQRMMEKLQNKSRKEEKKERKK